MATMTPDIHASPAAQAVSASYLQRLEDLARRHGWTLDETMDRALDLTEIVLNAKAEDPASKLYLYQRGNRYSVRIED